MGAPVPIRDDIPAEELRRLARLESNGRVACRLIALANVLDEMPGVCEGEVTRISISAEALASGRIR